MSNLDLKTCDNFHLNNQKSKLQPSLLHISCDKFKELEHKFLTKAGFPYVKSLLWLFQNPPMSPHSFKRVDTRAGCSISVVVSPEPQREAISPSYFYSTFLLCKGHVGTLRHNITLKAHVQLIIYCDPNNLSRVTAFQDTVPKSDIYLLLMYDLTFGCLKLVSVGCTQFTKKSRSLCIGDLSSSLLNNSLIFLSSAIYTSNDFICSSSLLIMKGDGGEREARQAFALSQQACSPSSSALLLLSLRWWKAPDCSQEQPVQLYGLQVPISSCDLDSLLTEGQLEALELQCTPGSPTPKGQGRAMIRLVKTGDHGIGTICILHRIKCPSWPLTTSPQTTPKSLLVLNPSSNPYLPQFLVALPLLPSFPIPHPDVSSHVCR